MAGGTPDLTVGNASGTADLDVELEGSSGGGGGSGVSDHPSLTGRTTAGQHPATAVAFTPAGGVLATDMQAAIVELDTEKSGTAHAHAASAVTSTATGDVAATTVQAAIAELAAEKETPAGAQSKADAAQAAAEAANALDLAGHEAAADPHAGYVTDAGLAAHTGAFTAVHGRTSALKVASTTAPNNTLAADPELFLDLAAGTHDISGLLLVRGAITDDFRAEMQFATPANGSGRWTLTGPAIAAVTREADATFAASSIGSGQPLSCGTGGAGSGGEVAIRIEATVTTVSAQRLTLWWSPVANVATTELRASSRMTGARLI